jgi:hypothetical protein
MSRTVVLNADLHGFGDACITAVIAENSRGRPVELVHRATGEMADFLRMLGQEVVDHEPNDCADTFLAYHTHEVELERGAVPRVLSRARALGIDLSDLTPETLRLPTATISEEATQWARRVCAEMRSFGHAKAVALWPQTCYQSREWPTGHWHDLAWGLRQHGIGSRFFLGKDEPRWHNTPGFVFGMGWEKWAAIMAEADENVAISSGPASLAAILRKRIISLEGPTRPTIWWHAPQVETMQVGTDRVSCVGCHFSSPFRSACDFGCFALAALTPAEVLARICERLNVPGDFQLHHWTARSVGARR